MSFLEEIQKQSGTARFVMFSLCVVTAISLVGMVWFNSFQKNLFAMIKTPDNKSDKSYVQTQPSKEGLAGRGLNYLRSSVYSVLGIGQEDNKKSNETFQGQVYLLPLSGRK